MVGLDFTYTIKEEILTPGEPNKKLGIIRRQKGMRPQVGMQLNIKDTIYKILRSEPANNPDDQPVTYIVEKFNPNAPFKPGINPRDARGPRRTRL